MRQYIIASDSPSTKDAIKKLVDQGARMVVGTSFDHFDPMYEVAPLYPTIKFLHISGYKTRPNMATAFARIEEARYLSGLVAGRTSKTGKFCYIAAMKIPEVYRGIAGFTIGVREVYPNASVAVYWTNSWFNPELERYAADLAIKEQGCDVIAQHQDTIEPQKAASEAGLNSVGYNSDMSLFIGDSVLTSATWNWGPLYVYMVGKLLNNSFVEEDVLWGIKEETVRLEQKAGFGYSFRVSVPTISYVESRRLQIMNGSMQIFCGKAVNDSKAWRDDQCLTMGQLYGELNWYMPGSRLVKDVSLPVVVKALQKDWVEFSDPIGIAIAILAILALLFVLCNVALLTYYRRHKVIISSSYIFCMTMCLGGVIGIASVFLQFGQPDAQSCTGYNWVLASGFAIFFGALVVKTHRINSIFNNQKLLTVRLSNSMLFSQIGVILLIEWILLAVFTARAPYVVRAYDDPISPLTKYYQQCNSNDRTVYTALLYVFNSCLVAYGAYLAFRTRHVHVEFNESAYIAASLYNVLFVSVIVVPVVAALGLSPSSAFILKAVGVICATCISTGILFIPKFLSIYNNEDENAFMKGPSFVRSRVSSLARASIKSFPDLQLPSSGQLTSATPEDLQVLLSQLQQCVSMIHGRMNRVGIANMNFSPRLSTTNPSGLSPRNSETSPKLGYQISLAMTSPKVSPDMPESPENSASEFPQSPSTQPLTTTNLP
eukprot:TRINITY_DN1975_c0_g1_i32.p1 TRINITY_DN1975_c0_g1~~TRINITY_DN1975_c0_g1_i32.p1  ORF type:complete len:715 (-),score=105.34 TRINITY_DN1975_c0_g1_i32:448-2592(-)